MNGWMVMVSAILMALGLWIMAANGYGQYSDVCGFPPQSSIDQHNIGFALLVVGLVGFAAGFIWVDDAPPASRKRAGEREKHGG